MEGFNPTAVVASVAIAEDPEPTSLEPLWVTINSGPLGTHIFEGDLLNGWSGAATTAVDGDEIAVPRDGSVVAEADETHELSVMAIWMYKHGD